HTARSRTDFVWEGFRLLQENVQQQGWRTYLYDAEQPYTPVASVTGRGESRQVWYYHTDVTGTPQEVTAADGTLVWAGYIRGFGENAADISNSGAYFHQPLRLPGQYFDDETGLHYNLFRYYAPECGRFVSQDPIGLAGGINLYQYAPNPLSWIDPLGLSPVSPKTVLFSQDSINAVFEDGRNVNGLIHRLINDPSYINEVEPIRKVRMRDLPANVQERLLSQGAHKDSVFSLDNRRLYAAKEAGVPKIPSRWATPEELSKINLDRRFSTSDGGKSIRTRGCG
ncbi:TPA: RHS repeat-associated core domain-containing protein, partial [Salmonella enterica]